ncbi:hypothetical protein CS063_09265 [Sporanaerobium hydrogeniformans]|uniref:Uncharacterized protein n=1 Tax=Sporanaerobium hydrogeniformans TaxID=3072179 RepID=A0AC61DBL1_9FIRM|nr:C-GCAxxG-C-C family protein [Sporanaerobium hydrogeniformans]PHV70709.1 hypothetical protein CS063_09265 [Sporanaerobium hydrogeniformans]
MKKSEKAAELFKKGFNCSQAIIGAFCEDYGIKMQTGLKIASGLGSGVRSAEICGAVSGAVLVIGLKYGSDNTDSKTLCNTKTEEFIKMFREINGSIVCRDILGCDITTPHGKEKALAEQYFTTVCLDMVVSAAQILEDLYY